MSKVDEGKEILAALGLPEAQQTAIASYTLLALADIGPRGKWSSAQRRSVKIHDILGFIKAKYEKTYAENTRETVRRQVIHQLEQARVVDRNPDDTSLPTNSPRTHYAISVEALQAIRSFGVPSFSKQASAFRARHGALLDVYRAERKLSMIPVRLPSGQELTLSVGRHNELQAAIIQDFAPRFAPGASVLYLGDAANKTLLLDKEELERLGVPVTKHDKLPDVVLHVPSRSWLLLVEAVTSHGPVSPKRFQEIEAVLGRCSLTRVYVSAFPDLAEFKRHLSDIAWETEVWISEIPDHLVHFNGEKFLGPLTK